ncbi:TIGR03943 family putative permease subunit [Streptosporangium subroseum]|uniref:TIGR03943 family putative permease subunit n=1 Tax=Streptosporangium subroseum TaxID=106412 RepID=UPI0015C58CAB|nr:TIGR03943 family protein [Streptosporangium subroseum]
MNRVTQNLVLTLLGCAVLRISAFSTTYLNYVKPGFRPFLIGAGAVLVILGIIGLVQSFRQKESSSGSDGEAHARDHSREPTPYDLTSQGSGDPAPYDLAAWHLASQGSISRGSAHGGSGDPASRDGRAPGDEDHAHGHDHAHGGPRIAWLMCLPVFAIFLIAPPALGSFAASRDDTPAPRSQVLSAFTPLTGDGAVDMPISEFIGRAWDDDKKSLTDREVRLTGFVVPARKKGQWYVTRMQIACCAADAFPLKVAVKGIEPPPTDTWVEVTGTWIPQTFGKMPNGVIYPQLSGRSLAKVAAPDEPYE